MTDPFWCVPWVPTLQCRDAALAANTVTRAADWWCYPRIATCDIVVGLRNGVPCRCNCCAWRCEGKLGRVFRDAARRYG